MRKLFAVGSSPHKWHGRLQLSADEEEHHVGSAKNSGTGNRRRTEPESPTRSHDQPPGESSEKKLTPDFRGGTRGRRAQSR
jgi:hypothetical protein